nr:probable inactive histone-lysine N-methyltransferase SUVR2 isoform X1 [Ipomoea batatas]
MVNPRIVSAFRAMKALGISEDKVKPALKHLLKLYNKNWDLIEEENYRPLVDTIFEYKEAEAANCEKSSKNAEQEDNLKEEEVGHEEPIRPLKRLRVRLKAHLSSPSSLGGTSQVRHDVEGAELLGLHNSSNGHMNSEPQSASCQFIAQNKGKQPVSPNATAQETYSLPQLSGANKSQPSSCCAGTGLGSERGKEVLSPQIMSAEKPSSEPNNAQSSKKKFHALIKPKEEPVTEDMHQEVPVSGTHAVSAKKGGSSNANGLIRNEDHPLDPKMQSGATLDVAYKNNASGLGFAWSTQVPSYTPESYPDLSTHLELLCAGGPHDHRMYHDPLLLHQLSNGPPLAPPSSHPQIYRTYRTRARSHSDDKESFIGCLPEPILDGAGISMMEVASPNLALSPPKDTPPTQAELQPTSRPIPPPPPSPQPTKREEYEPYDPLAARCLGDTQGAPLRPYRPHFIDSIRHGVREMVPAAGRFWMDSTPTGALGSRLVGDTMHKLEEELNQLRASHNTLLEEHNTLRNDHSRLRREHEALEKEFKEQGDNHALALQSAAQSAIYEWRGSEDFVRAADAHAITCMPTLLRSWLSTPYMSGEPMVEAMTSWQDGQDYRLFSSPPSVQILQDWVRTPGGRAAMGPIAEVWLRDTDKGRGRLVREGEAAFYMGQREMQDHLYGKLRRRFSSFSIPGWKLPDYLPLERPTSLVIPSSSSTLANAFLVTPERAQAGVTSSVAIPSEKQTHDHSDPVTDGSGAVGM